MNFALGENVPLLDIVFTRAWTAIGGHLVWSAIVGAAIVIAKEQHGFEFKDILINAFNILFISRWFTWHLGYIFNCTWQ